MPPEDEEETLVECRACGGHWKIKAPDGKLVICSWCNQGMMSAKQMAQWQNHKSGPRRVL